MGPIRIVTIQPPAPAPEVSVEATSDAALQLLDEALEHRPDVVCLPEYLNCMCFSSSPNPRWFDEGAETLLSQVRHRATSFNCNIILPMVVDEGTNRFNRAHVIDRDGKLVGSFDKVHVTQVERDLFNVAGGTQWPVFDLDFGRIAVMICYDGCFSETSRILTLQGAELLFWPSLQRSYTEDQLTLQMRAHAYFNYVPVVRSSYGGSDDPALRTVEMVGFSGVCAADGTLLQTLVHKPGYIVANVDLADRPCGSRTFGGQIGPLREMRFEDRQPHMYGDLSIPRVSPSCPHTGGPHYEALPSSATLSEEAND